MPTPHASRSRPFRAALVFALALVPIAGGAAPRPAPARRAAPAAAAASRASHAGDLARDTLAWVGGRVLTAADLVARIEMMPWPEKRDGAPMDSAKVRALQSLVGETLLAEEAERLGLGDSGAIARMREALRHALARDALYRELVAGVPAPPADEVERLAGPRAARLDPASRRALRRNVADSLHALTGSVRAEAFMRTMLASQRATVDSATFVTLADSLRGLMLAHPIPVSDTASSSLLPGYVDALLSRLAPALDRPLVHLADGPFTLGAALEASRFYVLPLQVHGRRRFAADLSAQLRTLVEGELLAREGLRRRLDERADVRRDLETWSTAWRAHLLLERVAASPPASDDDAFRRFALRDPERARALCEVDVEELRTPSRERAGELRAELEAGATFDSLARADAPGGARATRSGFFPVSRRPQLGFAALLAPLETLSGPLSLAEGFTVFRVKGKRLVADSAAAPPLLASAREEAAVAARSERVARFVASLAERGRVEMDVATLPRIQVASIEVLTRRSLGFGGGMLAVPSVTPLWDWVPLWRAARSVQP